MLEHHLAVGRDAARWGLIFGVTVLVLFALLSGLSFATSTGVGYAAAFSLQFPLLLAVVLLSAPCGACSIG